MSKIKKYLLVVFGALLFISNVAVAQHDHNHDHSGQDHSTHDHDKKGHKGDHAKDGHGGHHAKVICGIKKEHKFFVPGETAFHHVADANVYSIGPWSIPLPCILYAPSEGFSFFSSGKFEANKEHHGSGDYAYKGYILDEGTVKRVVDPSFTKDKVKINGGILHKMEMVDKKEKEVTYLCHNGKLSKVDRSSTADFGLFGGGITSFYDFSITKNVATMLLMFAFLAWMFIGIARKYTARRGQAPKGLQAVIEPVFLFIQEEVTKPFLGAKWEKYQPFLMSLFFFILGLNLFGQIPFLGGSNVTGNLAVTMVLAIFAFFVVNLSGNKHYWEHIFWMPGVPAWVKTILTPVEFLGVFIKPLTLMLRLFANITAGHMVMVIFVGLIFVFGKGNPFPSYATVIPSTLLTVFMMAIELLVAFIQAFVFTILTASYIGAAIEDHGHHEEAHH